MVKENQGICRTLMENKEVREATIRALEMAKALKHLDAEVGFGICKVNGRLVPTKRKPTWIGATYIPREYEGELVGFIHTHETEYFSDTDIITSLNVGLEFVCICYEKNGKKYLKCMELPEYGSEEWEDLLRNLLPTKGGELCRFIP